MTTPCRAVLIGCGYFAPNHLHGWAAAEGAEIVALCDLDRTKAEAMAAQFGIAQVYDDPARMLEELAPDVVDIVTTSPSHRTLVELATPHARAVVCQKPMADTLEDARAMVAAAESSGIPLIIHENFRWQKPFRDIAQLLARGDLGPVHHARFAFRHGFDNYVNQPYLRELERFTIMDVGLHLFDLAHHLVGPPENIACRTQRVNPQVRGEDAFVALIGHRNGATSVAEVSFEAHLTPHRFPQTTGWIECANGTIELNEDYRMILHNATGRSESSVEPLVPDWGERPWHVVQDSICAFQRHVVDVLAGRAAPQPSGQHNLVTLSMALAAYEAAETASVVRLPDTGAAT